MKFDTLKDNFSVPKAEEQVLEFWKKENIFHEANKLAKNRPHYVFYEGPGGPLFKWVPVSIMY